MAVDFSRASKWCVKLSKLFNGDEPLFSSALGSEGLCLLLSHFHELGALILIKHTVPEVRP